MAYYTGDIPAEDIVIAPARDEEPIDLTLFDEAATETVWRAYDGETIPAEFAVTFDDALLVVEWPESSPFDEAGLYTLAITLVSDDPPRRERLAPLYVVAQADDGWHTIDSARQEWYTGAPSLDRRLFQLLQMAKQQVVEFAPALADNEPVPANYAEAQLMQARNLWNAGRVDPSAGGLGDEEFVIRPFPLDWIVKQVLRPQKGIGAIG